MPFTWRHTPHVSHYPDVLVPLEQAHRHWTVDYLIEAAKRNPSVYTNADIEMNDLSTTRTASSSPAKTTIASLKTEAEGSLAAGGHDTAYDIKSKVINKAIQDIGMGKYQWQLFLLAGFGWLADQMWLQGIAATLDGIAADFHINTETVRYTTLSLFIGLCIGASFWGIASDVIGRRLAFNFTLFIAGAFGLAAGFAPNWVGTCAMYSCIGLGVGGNLPVDGALFLEFLPMASGSLLTLLSVWWSAGQLVASLVSWGFMVNCSDHWGWRYTIVTLGALTFFMFICRFFLFHFFETPKILLAGGKQEEAVAVVHGVAHVNGTKTWLSEQVLNEVGGHPDDGPDQELQTGEIIKRALAKFSIERVRPLFRGWRMGLTTLLVWFIWAAIGMGYPLFNAFLPLNLGKAGNMVVPRSTVYRNYAITSVVGVPGSIIACFIVNIRHFGRKGSMAIATLLSGIFLLLFARSTTPGYQLAMGSLEAFCSNIMYGVLFAYTPEVFPAPNRGTGTGIASFLNRVAGLVAPVVAVNVSKFHSQASLYAAAGLFFAAFIAMLCLPFETLGRQSL